MSFVVHRDDKRMECYLLGPVRFAELLTEKEYNRGKEGSMAVFSGSGALLGGRSVRSQFSPHRWPGDHSAISPA